MIVSPYTSCILLDNLNIFKKTKNVDKECQHEFKTCNKCSMNIQFKFYLLYQTEKNPKIKKKTINGGLCSVQQCFQIQKT